MSSPAAATRRLLLACVVALAGLSLVSTASASAAAWFKPSDFPTASPFTYLPYHPDAVAMSPNGNLVFGWVSNDGSGNSDAVIHLVVRPAGGPPGPEQTFNAAPAVQSVSVAVNDSGEAIAAWGAGGFNVHFSSFDFQYVVRPPGGAFGSPQPGQQVSSGTTEEDPAVGLAADGTATFAFESQCQGPSAADAAIALRRAPDGTWASPEILAQEETDSCDTGFDYSGFTIDELPGGRAIVGFNRETGSENQGTRNPGVAQTWSATRGAATGAFVSKRVGDGAHVTVATEAGGASLTAWDETFTSGLDGGSTVHWVYHPRTGTDVTGSIGSYEAPDAAMAADGEALLVFASTDGSLPPAVVRIDPAGSPGTPQALPPGSGYASRPQIVADSTGRAALAYKQQNGLETLVRAPGGSFGSPSLVGAGFIDYPVLAGDALGDAGLMGISVDLSGNTDVRTPAFYGYDGAPPQVSGVSGPAKLLTGQTGGYSVAAADVWGPATVSWAFGDGATAAGASASHAFTASGAMNVTATATDAHGNSAGATATTNVTAPFSGGGGTTGGGTNGGGSGTGGGGASGTGGGTADAAELKKLTSATAGDGSVRLTLTTTGPGKITVHSIGSRFKVDTIGGLFASAARRTSKHKQPALVVPITRTVTRSGTVTLVIRATPAAKKLIQRKGGLRVQLRVTFTPTSGAPSARTTTVAFKKRRGR